MLLDPYARRSRPRRYGHEASADGFTDRGEIRRYDAGGVLFLHGRGMPNREIIA